MAKVNFIRNRGGLVLAHYRYDKSRLLRYTTKTNIPEDCWTGRPGQWVKDVFPNAERINISFEKIQNEISNIHLKYRNNNEDLPVNIFKTELDAGLSRAEKIEKPRIPDIIRLFDLYIEKREKRYQAGTIRGLKVLRGILDEYRIYRGLKRLEFKELQGDFYSEFIEFLNDEHTRQRTKNGEKTELVQNFTPNYQGSIIGRFKTFLNDTWAFNKQVFLDSGINYPTWREKSWKVLREDSENIHLSAKEIELLYKHNFSDNPRLERIRDLFCAGCWLGLRYSDLKRIRGANITTDSEGNSVVKIRQLKTGRRVTIPVHWMLEDILRKYNGSLPSVPADPVFNRYVKEMAGAAGLNAAIGIERIDRGIRKAVNVPKNELVSSHTMRRSFCTNHYEAGTDVLTIMAVSGHKTIKSFMAYIKTGEEEFSKRLAKSPLYQRPELKRVAR